jgi:NAD(P)-dependent dehydrogenase (short-subunit alcohol dehydrogenase family)
MQMRVELNSVRVTLIGDHNPVAAAALVALRANGATVNDLASKVPDILVVSLPLLPVEGYAPDPLLQGARTTGAQMVERGNGRIVFLASAMAGMPTRRHATFSVGMAALVATVRTLAMECGPRVLVNAVGVGAVGEPLVAGDATMLSHASIKRSGTVQEVTDTLLFFCDPLNTYTTGQMLSVDGGWSVGYGRNF